MDDESRKIDYEQSANEYKRWVWTAENLGLAASYLEEIHTGSNKKMSADRLRGIKLGRVPIGIQVFAPMQYLKAKCLEVYLKALYIKNGKKVTDGSGNLSYKSHDLIKFYEDNQINLSEKEKSLLKKLTEAIIFWGTYPVPTTYQKWRQDIEGFTGIQPIYIWSSEDDATYKALVLGIQKRLRPARKR